MTRLRKNFLEGVLGADVTDSATSMVSLGFASIPEIVDGSGQVMAITIDPGGAREIVHVTAHDTAASTVTVIRGREGTTAAAHATGASWVNALTADDVRKPGAIEEAGAIESIVGVVAAAGSTETLDVSQHGVFDVTMDQNCTFTFSNPAPSGQATIFVLILRGAFTPTWPAGTKWALGSQPPHLTPAIYTFTTVDGGTTWMASQSGAGYS